MKPVLLLLHGLLNDERVWAPVAQRLQGRADIRIPNLRTQDSIARTAGHAWAVAANVPLLDVGAAAGVRQLRAIIGRGDHRAMLAALSMPALVLCGSDDQATPPELSREAAALIPGAKLVVAGGAGHWVPLEKPESRCRRTRPAARPARLTRRPERPDSPGRRVRRLCPHR